MRSCQASCIKVRARDILHEAGLVGTKYSRLSAVCNDWVYYVCQGGVTPIEPVQTFPTAVKILDRPN